MFRSHVAYIFRRIVEIKYAQFGTQVVYQIKSSRMYKEHTDRHSIPHVYINFKCHYAREQHQWIFLCADDRGYARKFAGDFDNIDELRLCSLDFPAQNVAVARLVKTRF